MSGQQLTMERPSLQANADAATWSTLKSILVHIQDDANLDRRLEAGLALARSTSGHLSCIHITPITAYVAFDTFGGLFVMKGVMEALDEREADLRSRIEKKLTKEDVSWDYEQLTGDVPNEITSHAAFADIVVADRAPHREDFVGPTVQMLGDLLHRCSSPIFIPGGDGNVVDPTGHAVIAWDGSYEAANTVRSSMGLLKLASSVTVVQVAEKKDERFPGTKMLEYLSRHCIAADLKLQSVPGESSDAAAVAATLVSEARALNGSYLVMGGYSHSRLGEYVFGGVTKTLLRDCPIALVIAH